MKQLYQLFILSLTILSIDITAQINVEGVEYWFDTYTNVSSQNITPGNSYTFNEAISTTHLKDGLHQFTIRFKDENDRWSAPVSQFFYKKPAKVSNNELISYEYWFDSEISNAVSSPISPGASFTLNDAFDLSDLSNGLHVFSMRFKDSHAQWSAPISQFVYKTEPAAANSQIAAYQYWIDDNIAEATDVAVTTNPTLALLDDLDLSTLKAGTHQFNIRFQDTNGRWSSPVSEEFLKVALSLNDHLIAHYPFNGNANDESGEEHHGTVYGASLASDRNGNTNQAYQFDGVDDYIDLGDWINGGATTITFWARWEAFHNYSRVVDLANGSSSDNIVVSNYQQGNRLFCQIYSTSTRNLTSTDNIITQGQWDFYAISVDETGHFKMYKNATLVDENISGVMPRELLRTEQFIGRSNFSQDGYFQGYIDDVRIYNKAIETSDINTVYNALSTNNSEIISLKSIKAYPNPVVSNLTVQLAGNDCRLTLYNQNGRCVLDKTSKNTEEEISMDKMQPGVYILRIISNDSQQTLKIVKK
ncbi:T9SS type A sorting domain-containing protein [Carboxylicivirga sp. A043]|uniref:LamG-like jellyroll fold domain-containing protein n=1 Tax=Carboxylicivirga litoralis TaxID=2816963 RepID=UPI0021CB43BA|nr:LamG-like jellyroll fold domain-containing protein [Carboxylicivirga sp. A043]MCU4157440.1 T9SS type A sorting domain-containing protein [Carboxylicivirga sp. A043]